MEGVFIQGGVKNANQCVYPVHEIERAVTSINGQLKDGYSVLGEVDHPDDLKINLDRVSHMITEMWMDGPCGHGKLKILPTPMVKLVEAMITSGVKLGVSSRGSGEVNESTGQVSITHLYHVIDPFYINPIDEVLSESAAQILVTSPHIAEHYKAHAHKLKLLPQCVDLVDCEQLLRLPLSISVPNPTLS